MTSEIHRPFEFARVKAVSIAGCLLLGLSGCSDPLLWEPAEMESELPPTPQAIRSETVAFDIDVLQGPSNERIRLSLPGRGEVTVVKTRFEPLRDQQFIWRGAIRDEPGSEVRFSVVERTLVGAIATASGQTYMIRSIRDGFALIEELDTTRFPPEEATEPISDGAVPDDPVGVIIASASPLDRTERGWLAARFELITTAQANPVTTLINVMVLYTSEAEKYLARKDGVTGAINLLVSDAQDSFIESGVPIDLELAHHELSEYQDTNDAYMDLQALKNSKEIDALETMDDLRKEYGADIVILLTNDVSDENKSSCGQSDELQDLDEMDCNSVFAAVPANCAVNIKSFTHEIGHVMGALHDQGFIAKSNAWYTIMASPRGGCKGPACKRISRFSNPAKTFANGSLPPESTGSASANNASRLNLSRTTVSDVSEKCSPNQQ